MVRIPQQRKQLGRLERSGIGVSSLESEICCLFEILLPHPRSPQSSPGQRTSVLGSHLDDACDDDDHMASGGVEKYGMIWGMKVEEYHALSARERKRVRSRV